MAQFGTCEAAEFVQQEVMIFWDQNKGTWKQIAGISEQGASPTVDVDGDGVPEFIGGTGYKDTTLWKVYPEFRVLAVASSGV